jgi:hypothetical protein
VSTCDGRIMEAKQYEQIRFRYSRLENTCRHFGRNWSRDKCLYRSVNETVTHENHMLVHPPVADRWQISLPSAKMDWCLLWDMQSSQLWISFIFGLKEGWRLRSVHDWDECTFDFVPCYCRSKTQGSYLPGRLSRIPKCRCCGIYYSRKLVRASVMIFKEYYKHVNQDWT